MKKTEEKLIDLCLCETAIGFTLAQVKTMSVFKGDEIVFDDGNKAIVIDTLSVVKGDDTFRFAYKLSKQTVLPKISKVVRYEEV